MALVTKAVLAKLSQVLGLAGAAAQVQLPEIINAVIELLPFVQESTTATFTATPGGTGGLTITTVPKDEIWWLLRYRAVGTVGTTKIDSFSITPPYNAAVNMTLDSWTAVNDHAATLGFPMRADPQTLIRVNVDTYVSGDIELTLFYLRLKTT